MADMSGSAAGAGKIWIGIGAAVVAAALGYFTLWQRGLAPVSDPGGSVATVPQAEQPTETIAPNVAKDTTDAEPSADNIAPAFDIVRIDPDGRAVIAGHAAPGATVQLSLNGAPIETLNADDAGNFVALLDVPTTAAGQLSLQALNEAGEVIEGADPVQTVLIEPGNALPEVEPDALVIADLEGEPAAPKQSSIVETDAETAAAPPRPLGG